MNIHNSCMCIAKYCKVGLKTANMRFAVEQAYSPHYLKAELVFTPTLQYFKTLYIFNSVIEIIGLLKKLSFYFLNQKLI